jgi:capsule polysaccharide export protein KpsE/RkpR
MISELRDEEILDFLMTSDFEQEYKPEELKYLLFKWRFFYRVLNGRFDLEKTNTTHEISCLNEEIKRLKTQISETQSQVATRDDQIHQLQNRKLTLRERISGKIIDKK